MERNANYALVGAASLLLFIAAVVFVFLAGEAGLQQAVRRVRRAVRRPCTRPFGRRRVHFNGIKVGDVSTIKLDSRDPNRVIARIKVTSDVPIREDSYATLEPQGITGINYLQITAGDPAKRLLKETVADGEVPIIRTQRSALSDLLAGGGTVLNANIEALDRVNRVLGDENIQTFGAALDDLQAFTAEAREQKEIIADAAAPWSPSRRPPRNIPSWPSPAATCWTRTLSRPWPTSTRPLARSTRPPPTSPPSWPSLMAR